MEEVFVIWGFMGPLILIGIIGIFIVHHINKKQEEEQEHED